MDNYTVDCLLCNINGDAQLISPSLRDDTSDTYKVVRCLTCGHIQLSPLPSINEEISYYRTDSQSRSLYNNIDFEVWRKKSSFDTNRRVKWLSTIVASPPETTTVLDIGCGYGFFVDHLTQIGFDTTGIDIGTERIELAKANLQGNFVEGQVDDKFVSSHISEYDVITLFHVLEHVRNPVYFIQLCLKMIKQDGYLLIEVPNVQDELLYHQEQYNNFYWQRAHLSYFDKSSLELALHKSKGSKGFIAYGVQRYGIRNLFHWLDNGKPQLKSPDHRATEPILANVEELYSRERERSFTSDTLIIEVQK